ncbi:MAG: ABC transporter ATP-binding protein [Planctomycetes bacterium]|nr:ABC transporter ATP-binding protein [Planctomycetota bacterium]
MSVVSPAISPLTLTFDSVTKFYGAVIGLNDLSCEIGPGITGLLGANGAGKSTLLKLASGQLRPTQGAVQVGTFAATTTAAKRLIGYCPDHAQLYEEMTGEEFVRTMCGLSGVSRDDIRRRSSEVLKELGMADRARRRIAGCSQGMRQRLKLAQAFVHDPQVILLDEPLTGIDPGGRKEIHDLLLRMADQGKTILLSSHLLNDIQSLVDRILVLGRGRLLASGSLSDIRQLLNDRPRLIQITCEDARPLAAQLIRLPQVQGCDVSGNRLFVRTKQVADFYSQIQQLIIRNGHEIRQLECLDEGAEAIFDYLQEGNRSS